MQQSYVVYQPQFPKILPQRGNTIILPHLIDERAMANSNIANGYQYNYLPPYLSNSQGRMANVSDSFDNSYKVPRMHQNMVSSISKWNLSQQSGTNVNNFPFGRERAELSNYVTQQMQPSIDDENKRVLQKFRIQAIKHRNQRVMKHLGKIPYITESMLPGSSIDASIFVQKQKSGLNNYYQPINYAPTILPQKYSAPVYIVESDVQKPSSKPKQVIKIPRKNPSQSTSIGISVNFEQQFPLKKHKKKQKHKKYYTIEDQQQQKQLGKIQNMLHELNHKLKRNSQMLQNSFVLDNLPLSKSRVLTENQEQKQLKFTYSRQNYFPNPELEQSKPSIQYYFEKNDLNYIKKGVKSRSMISQKERYSKKGFLAEPNNKYSKQFLRKNLQLLKKNRKRIEDLDEYVYEL